MEWISVKDRLPKDNHKILMCTNLENMFSGKGAIFKMGLEPRTPKGFDREHYTHWMPLPEPPKD